MLNTLAQIQVTIPEDPQQIVDQVKANPTLLAILVGVGVLTAIVFFWGLVKQTFKAAIFGGTLSVLAWVWYFNVR
jgi:hypothetical protein